MANLNELQAQLDAINAELAKVQTADKIMKKIKNTRLNNRTAHKYFDLQALYVETTRVNMEQHNG